MKFIEDLKKEIDNPKIKTDNVLMQLFNGMKMIGLPKDYIDNVKEYVKTNIFPVKDVKSFETMENKKIFSVSSFYDIISYIINLMASGHLSEYKENITDI